MGFITNTLSASEYYRTLATGQGLEKTALASINRFCQSSPREDALLQVMTDLSCLSQRLDYEVVQTSYLPRSATEAASGRSRRAL